MSLLYGKDALGISRIGCYNLGLYSMWRNNKERKRGVMTIEWQIIHQSITVKCECGAYLEFGKRDIKGLSYKTCKYCGRMISVQIGIDTYKKESED